VLPDEIICVVNPDLLTMQQQLQQLNTQIALSEIEVRTELETLKSQRST